MHEYTGIIHVHSVFSDGTGDRAEIVGTARSLGLDFLVMTDHMTLEARKAGWEGYHGKVLLVVGYEHHDSNWKNHYLIIGEDNQVLPGNLSPSEYIREAWQNGCAGFIAHPTEKRKAIASLPPYPWQDWSVEGFSGIEIWNQLSDWVEQVTFKNILFRVFFPRRFLNPPPPELLERWDRLNQTGHVSAIGGVDAHAHRYTLGPFSYTLMPYKVSFQSIRTHVLEKEPFSGNFASDRSRLIKALAAGRSFISNFRNGDARGFRSWIEGPSHSLELGCEGPFRNGMVARIQLPESGEIRLIGNGKTVASASGMAADFPIKHPGVFRIEVARKEKAWIYSNPIFVRAA